MVAFVLWTMVVTSGVLVLVVPGVRHRRRVKAWERELAVAFGQTDPADWSRVSASSNRLAGPSGRR